MNICTTTDASVLVLQVLAFSIKKNLKFTKDFKDFKIQPWILIRMIGYDVSDSHIFIFPFISDSSTKPHNV